MDMITSSEEFEKSKMGVKGLVDAGVTHLPEFFCLPPDHRVALSPTKSTSHFNVPVIDLQGVEGGRRREIAGEIREASSSSGMFYVIGHGVPAEVMSAMLEADRKFHEQPAAAKAEVYGRGGGGRKVSYYASFHPRLERFLWKDSLVCEIEGISCTDVPLPCREALWEYTKHVNKLKGELSSLLSEALGLQSDYLDKLCCMDAQRVLCHYFPACPDPEKTIGTTHHSDQSFLTILMTNDVSGLQVLHQGHWVDVAPMKGAFIVNIGDMLQLITNDLFKSADHRVLAGRTGPRLSVACFLFPSSKNKDRKYSVIKELIKENDRPPYEEISFSDYVTNFQSKGICYPNSEIYLRQ